MHVIVAEAGRQNLRQHAERIVDTQRIRRLAEPDAGHIERRPAFDQHDLDSSPGEGAGRRQPADTATHDQDTSNFAHAIVFSREADTGQRAQPTHAKPRGQFAPESAINYE